MLALMAAAGLDSVRMLARIETRNSEISHVYLNRSHVLERIRGALYLSSTDIRDYLLDPDAAAAKNHLAHFRKLQAGMGADLNEYSRLFPAAGEPALSALRAHLDSYWNALDPAFSWDARDRRLKGYSFLTEVVIPYRTKVLQAADDIAALNENQVRESERQSDNLFREFRLRTLLVLALALMLGALLSWFSVSHTVRLEREARARYAEILRTRDELERLSARLVDAQEQERRSISRELHDEVGQSLGALLVDLGNAIASIPGDRPELRKTLASAKQSAEGIIGVVRNMALLLRPSMLDDFGLVPALHWLAREASRRTGLRVEVSADEVGDDLPDEHKTCIYRLVQEALHNCSRHAEAKLVKIVVREEPSRILMAVQDDGKGFEARLVRGLGLVGMEERVKHLGGEFEVRSEPGKGTLLRVELPLARAEAAAQSGSA